MKNLKITSINTFIVLMLSVLLFSCNNEDQSNSSLTPVITSVAASDYDANGVPTELTPVTQGFANNVYIIRGTGLGSVEKIYINGVDTYFNPTLVTDTDIFVTIDINTPYANASNEIKVITKTGTVVFPFIVAPPAPQFKSYNPINPAAGDVVTIYGDFFLNPIVKIGGITVPVLSSTLTEIKFNAPSNIQNKYVSVTTISGTNTASQAIGSACYDDALQGSTAQWDWGPFPKDQNYTEDVYQGKQCWKMGFNGWGGYEVVFDGKSLTQYKSFRIALKGNKDGQLKLVFNGDNGGWSYQILMPVTTQWAVVEVPFKDIGNPTNLNKLTFQEAGNFGGNVILMDDWGFILK